MLIQIRYESIAEKKGKVATVINVASNNTYIRFGWLIDAAVTANAGDIIFEIMATGVNEKETIIFGEPDQMVSLLFFKD